MTREPLDRHKSPVYTQPFSLEPIDFTNQDERDSLVQQRKICGWDWEVERLEQWSDQISRGVKFMWWIIVSTSGSTDAGVTKPGSKAGHIALSAEASPPDAELARSDRSIMTVTTFFILPEYRKMGLGRAVWSEVEDRARRVPECQQIAIDTIDRRYIFDDSPEWKPFLAQFGVVMNPDVIQEDWYMKMGYQKFKNKPKYPLPGTDQLMVATCLRKYLK